MRPNRNQVVILLIVSFLAASCSLLPRVPVEELEPIVQRDSVAFDVQSIPDEFLDRLASHQVVVVGETHFLREHRAFVAQLLRDLHARGFRQFLFEWAQAADWLMDDFVMDGGLEPDWAPPASIGGDMLTAIRDFNRTLPEDDRIVVHGIDIMLPDYGGGAGFQASLGALAKHLPDSGPLSTLLQSDYSTSESQVAQLKELQNLLDDRDTELISLWGDSKYTTVVELVEGELLSAPIREIRDSNYDKFVPLHEDAIKQLVDWRLQEQDGGTLINIGATHAQKKNLWGSDDIEWLGDYLAYNSPVADGSTFVFIVSAARILPVDGSETPGYNLMETSRENDILRVMYNIWPEQISFFPLDDPLFSTERVVISSEGTTYAGKLKSHFDALVLLPFAQRVPSSD